MKKLGPIAILFFLLSGAFPVMAFAPATETQIQWPPSPVTRILLTPSTQFHTFIAYIYEWGISLGGIAVFAMLVWAGIQYLTSAGDPGKMSSAMKRIQSSILGLVLLLTSWLVLNTINPQLVQLDPLPDLWRGKLIPGARMMPGWSDVPPCDFVIVYPKENFGGGPRPPIRFRPGQEAIVIEGRGTPLPQFDIGTGIIPDHGATPRGLDFYSNPWTSAKNFVKLNEDDKRMLAQGIKINRYNELGIRDDVNGPYKQGGFCWIELFYTTRRWLTVNPCGGALGRIQLPEQRSIPDLRTNFDKEITCAKVARRLPEPTPPAQPTAPTAPTTPILPPPETMITP